MDDPLIADAYLLRRKQAAQDEALDWLKGGQAPQAAQAPARGAQPQTQAKAAPQGQSAVDGVLGVAGAVAGDIGRGLIEAPGAVLQGMANAANEAIEIADAVAGWAESASGLGGLEFGYGADPEMLRPDGTIKGSGWLGTLNRPDGGVSTEISVGVDIDGKETLIPLLVPTLTDDEKAWLLENDPDPNAIPDPIMRKAIEHARSRIDEGESPFKDDGSKKFSIRMLSAEELAEKRAKGEDLASKMRIPTADWMKSESVTGGIVEGAAQFLTGFSVASRALKGTKVAAAVGQWGISMLAGAAADATVFDEHSQRLSNLVEEFPALRNPVTEYLKADPTDSMAEGKLKNALEGLGLGVVTHGLGLALKGIRSFYQARGTDAADEVLGAKRAKQATLDELEVEVKTIDPDGNAGTAKMPAGAALKEIDEGISTMRALLECLE